MANNCSNELRQDKIPIAVKKAEFYFYRAVKNAGISFVNLPTISLETKLDLFKEARVELEKDMVSYAKKANKLKEEGREEDAELYNEIAVNLQTINANWERVVGTFASQFENLLNFKTKFRTGEDGLVDLGDTSDEEKAFTAKFIFDQQANEIDPVDNIQKSVELFLRSIERKDVADEYGFTVLADYGGLVRTLSTDLENSMYLDEIVQRLERNSEAVVEYKQIIEQLQPKPTDTASDEQFRIDFRNSFAKAVVPIYTISSEVDNQGNPTVKKVFEATNNKKTGYEQLVNSNFLRRGMPVAVNGEKINLAHEENGIWVVNKTDLQKVKDFLNDKNIPIGEKTERRIQFLEALGFEFSTQSRRLLVTSVPNINTVVDYIANHFVRAIESGKRIKDPIHTISNNVYLEKKKFDGQKRNLNLIIDFEIKNNKSFNVERSIVNQDGNLQYAIQNHNNFTVINKYLSDVVTYPTLQDILKEPSMYWMDPEKNPTIKNSIYLNSLFFLDVDPTNELYGKRRRVDGDNYSATKGTFVTLSIVNTGGFQIKNERGFKEDSASSTGLEAIDKFFQDVLSFISAKGYNSVQRLSDKSTDIGVSLNYYYDPISKKPLKRILGDNREHSNIFSSPLFVENFMRGLEDMMAIKYLHKKGFYKELTEANNALKDEENWGVYTDILKINDANAILAMMVKNATSVESLSGALRDPEVREFIIESMNEYFDDYKKRVFNLLKPVKDLVPTESLLGKNLDYEKTIEFYLANSFLSDIENLKVFFGDAIFFSAFFKRNSKDSATGIFTFVEDSLIEKLNDQSSTQGYGAYTNLASRLLLERLIETNVINKELKDQLSLGLTLSKSFKSAVLKDLRFDSEYLSEIKKNVEILVNDKIISKKEAAFYEKGLKAAIEKGYVNANEADGQGKCTFDFYRIMSILTSSWDDKQEELYKKITLYSHYDQLASSTKDENKRAEYLQKRDALGYDPLEPVYFPPKKFQYAGPSKHEKSIDGGLYAQMVPIFDKFSLQPLIPTIVKGTADEELMNRMLLNGVGYVKFESGSKTESPSEKDEYFVDYKSSKPGERSIYTLEQLLQTDTYKFKSEQELFFNHFKEQVRIDAKIHEDVVYGSQPRKLILMNLFGVDISSSERAEFKPLIDKYNKIISDLIKIEKRSLYAELGIREAADGISSINIEKLVKYFYKEIDKKNQDPSVKKALNYNEETGKFTIPLDGAVQAQIIEGIVISAFNNRLVRYKGNGSMLTQVSRAGSELKKFDKADSKRALETFGNKDLKYYRLEKGADGKLKTAPMQVKIALTGKWLSLLELKHPDGNKIVTLERLNDALKDDTFKKDNKEAITLVGYRIPTQGLNFIFGLEVVEFLPASFGDAIILPSEIVINSGSDFDIDKLFVFYPNLYNKEDQFAGRAIKTSGKEGLENELLSTTLEIILHPKNYLQLVTPSANFEIMGIINKVYEKVYGAKRTNTNYKNTQLVDRDYNLRKFLSLLKGKSDLGIAALANTFNILYQLSEAKANVEFLKEKEIKTFFNSPYVTKDPRTNAITDIQYGSVFDEAGSYKSEFFAEFISAFVDVANDDYVFALNVVTELSPVIFYMKYIGLSTEKIISFINQPAIREYTKNLSTYDTLSVQSQHVAEKEKLERFLEKELKNPDADPEALADIIDNVDKRLTYLKYSARRKALSQTLNSLGFSNVSPNKKSIQNELRVYTVALDDKNLYKNITNKDVNLSELTPEDKKFQLAILFELENLKIQSDSMTFTQRFLNFDTKPIENSFDIYMRKDKYLQAKAGGTVLSIESIDKIIKDSPISGLNISKDVDTVLDKLLPVRNAKSINSFILNQVRRLRGFEYKNNIQTEDDMISYSRTFKNDFMSYLLYNFLDKSEEGKAFFKREFNTDKSIGEYVKELVESTKLLEGLNKIKNLSLEDYQNLVEQFPFIRNIVIRQGDNNEKIQAFKLLETSRHPVDRASLLYQFDKITKLESEESQEIKQFFKDLALYATFQSGYNYGEFSYTSAAPMDLLNPLYGYSVDKFLTLTEDAKKEVYTKFSAMFEQNNPAFYSQARKSSDTLIRDLNKYGKWYSESVNLTFKESGFQGAMTYSYGSDKRKEVTADTTFDAILKGERTATTRYESNDNIDYWKSAKVGDTITWKSADGRTVDVIVTKPLHKLKGSGKTAEQWSKLEGWSVDYFNRKVRPRLDEAWQIEYELATQPTRPSARKTYSGKVTNLQPNQIFVFGSNEGSSKGDAPTHGAGSAKIARDKFGAIQGQSRGIQGQSYGIVTKKYYDVKRSSTPQEIIAEIKGLYRYAEQNSNKEFLVSDYSESNLNGYTGQEMADMFNAAGPIPSNIVFNENFDRLVSTTQPTPSQASVSQTNKPKGVEVKEGIYVNQEALTKEEQLELFNYLKPFLEEQAAKTNKGANASKMIGLGLRWDYKSNNLDKTAINIPDVINPGNINKYGYYNTSINNKPLGNITTRFRELMQKATGVDMTNYDGAIINLYDNTSFISSHNDVDESSSAIKYPVIGINIGGTGNFSIESRDGSPKQLDLKAGTAYVFGVDGVNRDVFHRTFPGKQDSFLPALTTKIDGKTYEPGSYRVTITMRRVMPLQENMSSSPNIISNAVESGKVVEGADKPTFNLLPGKNTTPTMTYAGIGSRETPKEILDIMSKVAKYLESLGYTLRSGRAEGADKAFEAGVSKLKEIFLGFDKTGDREIKIAHEIHPNLTGAMNASKAKKIREKLAAGASQEEANRSGERSAWAVQNLMARNTNQIFGKNLDSSVDFVLFWAKEVPGSIRPKGGTGQAVEMARRKGIPTINLADSNWKNQLIALLDKLSVVKPAVKPAGKIKPGVAELFESNPELANAVYEAAGIGKFRVTLGKELDPEQKFGSQGEPIVKKFEVLDENKKIIGTVTLDIAKKGAITAHPKLTTIGKGYGQELYQIISLTFGAPVIEWGPHNISKSLEGKKLWSSLEKKGLAKAKYQWDDDIYLRGIDLSQQKQQAQQLYSQYLEQGGNKQDIEGFKKYVEKPAAVATKKYTIQDLAKENKGKVVDIQYSKYKKSFKATVTGEVEVVSESFITNTDTGEKTITNRIYDMSFKTSTGKIVTANPYYEVKGLTGVEKLSDDSFNETYASSTPEVKSDLKDKISKWVEEELPWKIETSLEKIEEMYEKEKLSGETIEEFLHRMSCLGKLK